LAGYMGDKLNMVVHHLAVMKPECMLYYVEKENRVTLFQIPLTKQKKKDLPHAVIVLARQPKP